MIVINNKTYKEHSIVLVPSDNKLSIIGLYVDTERLVFNNPNNSDINRGMPQDLYILSDDTIKIGDWYYNPSNTVVGKPHIEQCEQDYEAKACLNKPTCKKIIATTNVNLNSFEMRRLPQDFIIDYVNEYNQGNIISKVLLEVTKSWEEYVLKLNNNNVIIGVLDKIPYVVQQLLYKKAEASNKVDLDAYASGLLDMYYHLQKINNNFLL